MRGLRASIYKDIKLFLRGAGIWSLLLPFLLLPALRWGVADLSGQSYVRPFPIAVRDLDGTVMSRSLVSQLGQLELFSEVRVLDMETTDEQAVAGGAAAVVTIPRDFFYEMYTMSDCPAAVTLNSGMGLESAIFRQIVRSVMDIVRSDQAAGIGAYTLAYGELTPEMYDALYAETSENLFRDALGRQQVFDEAVQEADLAGALQRRLAACVLAVSAMFLALSAARTLPEELALGTLPRFRCAGCGAGAFLFSKFCAAFVLSLPLTAAAALLFPGAGLWPLLALDLALLWAVFGVFAAVSLWTGDSPAAQRWGNLLLLLSLAAGGAIWPRSALPASLAWVGKLTPPYYAALGLEALAQRAPFGSVADLLWPLPVLGAAGLVLTALGLRRRQHGTAARPAVVSCQRSDAAAPDAGPAGGLSRRLAGLSLFKLRAAAGGVPGLAALTAAALLCGTVCASARSGGADRLRLALCDLDGTAASEELAQSVAEAEGVSCAPYELSRARRALLTGSVEGVLVISPGYAASLERGADACLHYEAAGSSLAAQAAREIAAGKASAQRSRLRAAGQAERLLGRALTEEETAALLERIRQAEQAIPPLYVLGQEQGAPLSALFSPGQMSFAALAALFTLLTAASWFASGAGRMAERRMAAMPRGRLLSYGSDCLALTVLGLWVTAAVLLPGKNAAQLPAAAAYALCAAALSLALTRLSAAAGRVDALAPFLALGLCLLGGCFLDIRELSPAVAAASLLSPAGLAVRAAEGSAGAGLALLAEGAVLFIFGMPRQGKRLF